MQSTQSASISSSERGNGDRLGVRTRKKHKRLDAISEDVFNRNRNVEMGSSDGLELRRSSRVRKAPEVLDSSPAPKRKRRKIERFGREGGRGGLRRKGKAGNESGSSDEELGAWSLRSNMRLRMKGRSSRGKRKLRFKNGEKEDEDEEEEESMRDELENKEPCSDDEKLGDEEDDDDKVDNVGGSKDNESEMEDDRPMEENGVDDSENNLTVGKGDVNEDSMEVRANTVVEENVDRNDHTGGSGAAEKGTEDQLKDTEGDPSIPTDLAENKNNDMTKDIEVEVEVRRVKTDGGVGVKVKSSNVDTGGIPRPRVKEGRRCGLCGGGTDGKPPKKLVTDSAGSDQEAYSGSSASEEFNYDAWDGFGDEPGWLGRLLGPVNDRLGIARIWVHQHCAVWSPEVYFAGLGRLKNIRAALCRGRALKCTRCGRPGATLGCRVDRCPRTYHLPCARASGCNFDHRKFMIACADHRYLFEPHGQQYSQRLKKLKAKKMKLEIRKLSNDASRKDLEAEEKWMEKCGEDEEFLRRETKRLQRDLVRIAPTYIGGSHSEGENPIGGWESVAGLQDVVQCMKEVVILPLLYPEFFQNMGITPPRGVLLHGYPGTGKTLIVRALIGSCARGDKRIAYFARKGADCLGKYVGDAERQLRLLFQVAEKSQPSIIFFDEIDGLAPVRTRQQDQTHSSVVSTLLALMDGLKSRGSVIVIGATNRPDSVDPALRRPGRFDREIYFPLPSVKDRAAILALHTRKWPKPVSGPLLEWVSTQTVGFAGADLQALCSQAAVIALKRNCSWNQILSCAAENPLKGRRPELPSFVVEERDWLEALSLAPPPCSRREAGMAANEVLGTPLDIHLTPCLLQPLLSLITSLYLDDRHWLPFGLVAAGRAIKKAVDSQMAEKNLLNDKWSSLAQKLAQDPNFAREIVSSLLTVGIVKGDEPLTGTDVPKDVSSDDGETHQCSFGVDPSGLLRNVGDTSSKKTGYRIMISGAPRSGQKHLASCLLHCFLGNVEVQKIDLATISQEGHGDMEQGILRILMKCASQRMCVIFMPRIDFWAVESCNQSLEQDVEASPVHESPKESSELVATPDIDNRICNVSKIWKIFREQLECLCVSSSLIILATSELPCADLPGEICQFFGNQPLASEGLKPIEYGSSRFCVEVNGEVDHNKLIHLSAIDLSRNLIQQFVHVAHMGSHHDSHSSVAQDHSEVTGDISACETHLRSIKEPGAVKQPSEDSATKSQTSSVYKNVKEKSTLVVALTTFGYQILRFPHFAELCWVTSKLNEGPSADICGPWKGWPFNSCIVRPCLPMQKDVVACNNINGKGKFTLVRGLIAVALSAYRGVYKSSREVSLDVRKVLELLVGQISARIQAGKNKYQYIRLLSQVAFLEDMVNNWSNSLKSLEPDDQIPVIATSAEDHQVTVESMAVEANPNIESGDVLGTQLATGGISGSTAEDPVDIDLNVPACSTQGDDFQKPEFVEGGIHGSLAENSHLSDLMTEAVGVGVGAGDRTNFAIIDEMSSGKADVGVDNPTDSAITNEVSPVKAVSVNNHNYVEIMDEMPLEKTVDVGVDNRTDVQNTHENSQEITVSLNHKDPQNFPAEEDVNQDSQDKMPSKSEIVCFYSCCTVCISTLQKSLEELIVQEREHSGFCCTLEDIHDLISSVSTKLCSAVRNVYITGESRNLVYRKPNSEFSMNFESQSSNVNQCRSSECGLSVLTDCICHSESKTSSSSYDQPGFHSRYIFRDGVLVSGAPEELSFHCRYNALSLSSLIELILRTKQPTD